MHQHSKYDTQYYISLFQQGDDRGLNFVFKNLYRLMVFYANKRVNNWQLAEEIAADAFLKLWPHHYKFDKLSGIKSYLFKIVERDCIRAIQKEKSNTGSILSAAEATEENRNIFQTLVTAETNNILYQAIAKLSPGMRAVMESLYIDGNTPTQTAKILNLNTSTVDTQKKRALAAISKIIPRLSVLFSLIGTFTNNLF